MKHFARLILKTFWRSQGFRIGVVVFMDELEEKQKEWEKANDREW